ncbi:hypothetical protein GGI00_002879, partial [Coemansia sp. RSA 2681]
MPITEADSTPTPPEPPQSQQQLRPVRRAVSRKQRPVEDASSSTQQAAGTLIDKAVFLRKFTENALLQVKEGNHEEYSKLVKVFLYSQREAGLAPEQYVQDVTPWISAVSANVS